MIEALGLTVDRLSVERGGRCVLEGLSFRLPPGGAILVTGGNGAGKSTLLRALAGLIPRQSGDLALRLDARTAGRPLLPSREKVDRAQRETDEGGVAETAPSSALRAPSPARGEGEAAGGLVSADIAEHTHYLGHANGLKLALTAGENLRFYAEWGGGAGVAPAAALASVGLGHVADIPVSVLSAGQRRRVALARLLVAHRPLWLLDEPATALDAGSEGWLNTLMRDHLARGGLLMAAIHNPLDIPGRELRLAA